MDGMNGSWTREMMIIGRILWYYWRNGGKRQAAGKIGSPRSDFRKVKVPVNRISSSLLFPVLVNQFKSDKDKMAGSSHPFPPFVAVASDDDEQHTTTTYHIPTTK